MAAAEAPARKRLAPNYSGDDAADPLALSRPMLDALLALAPPDAAPSSSSSSHSQQQQQQQQTTSANLERLLGIAAEQQQQQQQQQQQKCSQKTSARSAASAKQQWWTELRTLVRQIYREATPQTMDAFSAAFDTAYGLVARLADADPGLLFARLEREAQDWAEAMRASVVETAATEPDDVVDVAQVHLEDLAAANAVFETVLVHFQNAFLRQFRISFSDVNYGVVNEAVLKDPVVIAVLGKAKASQSRAFVACERLVKDGAVRWRRARDTVTRCSTEMAKEVRIKEECSRLHLVLHELMADAEGAADVAATSYDDSRQPPEDTVDFDFEFCDAQELPTYKTAKTEEDVADLHAKRAHCCPQCCPYVFTYWKEPGPNDTLTAFQVTRRKLRVRIREYHIALKMRTPIFPEPARSHTPEADERPLDALVSFVIGEGSGNRALAAVASAAATLGGEQGTTSRSRKKKQAQAAAAATTPTQSASPAPSKGGERRKQAERQKQLEVLQNLSQHQKKKKKEKKKSKRKEKAPAAAPASAAAPAPQPPALSPPQPLVSSLEAKLRDLPTEYPRFEDANSEPDEAEEEEEEDALSDHELLAQADREVEAFRKSLETAQPTASRRRIVPLALRR